ncbi:MAG: ExeM/NucH family extracellular endonuclease [Cellvibrionales bacterium]|nr:ExeM/NucH family extracellular endonuclease [Cellvibrionales bacterium]
MKLTPFSLLVILLSSMPMLGHAGWVINEVDADNPGADTAEFVELFDGGTGHVALDGYSLVFFNGNDDQSYFVQDLDGFSSNHVGFFVICGDANHVANCDLAVSGSFQIQNGADAVAIYQADATDFPSGTQVSTANLIDALVYDTNDADDAGLLPLVNTGQPQVNEAGSGSASEHSNQRCVDGGNEGEGSARNTAGFQQFPPTPGADNTCESESVEPPIGQDCGDPATVISQIQGEITTMQQDASPLLGQQVTVEAIVTKDLQGGVLANGALSQQYRGFWLQEETSDQDANSATSEGVFVYYQAHQVNLGDKVRLTASVNEYKRVTQLKNITELTLCSSNNALPDAVALTLPASPLAFEQVEGMLVRSANDWVVSDLHGRGFGLGNYGEFAVSSELMFQPTEIAAPLSAEYHAALLKKVNDYLLVDDGVMASYPEFIPFPSNTGFSADNPLRIGQTVRQLVAVMHGRDYFFTLIPDSLTIIDTHPRTEAPQVHPNANLVIAGMNVLNYFNGDGKGGGFPTSRGAKTPEALAMQEAKLVAAIIAMDADVVGLMEIENDGFGQYSAIQSLVDALNAEQSSDGAYQFIQPPVATQVGGDEIAVGLLYRPSKLIARGDAVILDSANSPVDEHGVLFDTTKNRASIIQTFSMQGFSFTLAVNHLKSKGSACDEPNEGDDGQGNCNSMRARAAQGLAEFLAANPTNVPSNGTLILGDINAYSQEDPIKVLASAGFINLKYTDKSTEEKPFSFTFSGFLGSLDHALADAQFFEKVVSIDAWHINSIEDSLIDYQTEANGQSYESIDHYAVPDAYRSSDHDPLVIGLYVEKPKDDTPLRFDRLIGAVNYAFLVVLFSLLIIRKRS